jgi:CxxC-x17-CxxC domain-containing protein
LLILFSRCVIMKMLV